MTDHQDDPIAMYLIVNEELLEDMGEGKCCAQVGHAVSMLMMDYHRLSKRYDKHLETNGLFPRNAEENWQAQYFLWSDWIKDGIRKITLRADKKEWEKLKSEHGKEIVLVQDAGFTKLEAGSETVIGFPPMRKSQRPKLLKRLQAL